MTKDSICKDCKHRSYIKGKYRKAAYSSTWCLKNRGVEGDDYKILECSEFERIQKPREWKDGEWRNTK